MAADGTPLLRVSAIPAAVANDRIEELASRRDSVAAKRGRGGALEELREEADAARGWSSAVAERGLALRRRGGGSASFCRPRGGLVDTTAGATATEERRGRRQEADDASCALIRVGAEAEEPEPVVDPGVAFFCLAVL